MQRFKTQYNWYNVYTSKEGNSKNYFMEMDRINKELRLKDLSMGMSNDYLEAVSNNATFLRIGSKIFGERS